MIRDLITACILDRLYKPIPVNILETRVKSLLQYEKARRQASSHPAAS